ncbi:MAG: hypothetical protein ABR567_19635 [Myxococcales bacterium]|nr:hypothetical protein [Myxococcales bacterium]
MREMILRLASSSEPALAALFRRALGGRRVALCFHRVSDTRRPGEMVPKLTMPAAQIDALIRFLLDAARRDDRWLTVSFDDGYRDGAEYVLSRAPRFPSVEWLWFVCPEKTERQAGFRWDLAEVNGDAASIVAPLDPALENFRDELRAVAARPEFALADLATCRKIQALPNATLGDHSNVHHRMPADVCRAEYEASLTDFRRLFGEPARHFAFPYGIPGVDFDRPHVDALRSLGRFQIWSTEPRPYAASERERGAVLPRFAVDGTRTWRETAAHIALHALRVRGARECFPEAR